MSTVQAEAPIGATGWRLVGMPDGAGSCDHCGRSLKHLYRVVDPTGRELVVGRGCVKRLTGWTLAAAEAARLLRIAERDAQRAASWAQFASEHPDQAALIEADVAAYERQASRGMGACASHEIRDRVGDGYAYRSELVADYLRRRPTFWWTR